MSRSKIGKRRTNMIDQFAIEDMRKEDLVREFLNKSKEMTKGNKKPELQPKPVTKVETPIPNMELTIAQKDKLIKELENKLKKSNKQIKLAEERVSTFKRKVYDIKQDCKELSHIIATKDKQLEAKELEHQGDLQKIAELQQVIKQRDDTLESYKKTLSIRQKILNAKRDTIIGLSNKVDKLNNKLADLQNLLGSSTEDGLVDRITELRSEITKLHMRYRQELNTQEQHYKSILQQKTDELLLSGTSGKVEVVAKTEFGYLQSLNGVQYFRDTFNNLKRIHKFSDGSPCKAEIIDSNSVHIVKVYDNEVIDNITPSEQHKHKLKIKTKTESERLVFDREYSLLLICSERVDIYMSELKKSNLVVKCFNSFDKSYEQLDRIVGDFDVVVCCKDHAKHWAVDYILSKQKEDMYKYNVLSKDTVSRVLGRVNYAIANMK